MEAKRRPEQGSDFVANRDKRRIRVIRLPIMKNALGSWPLAADHENA
jgi:hypothetical protein